MRSIFHNFIILLIVFLAWMTISHFFTGAYFLSAMVVMTACFVMYIRRTKKRVSALSISKERIKKIDAICHVVAVAVLITGVITFFLVLLPDNKNDAFGVGFIVCAIGWFGIEFCNIVASYSDQYALFHCKRLIAISSAGVILPIYPALSPMLFGMEVSLRAILIPTCLSVIVSAYLYYLDGIRSQDMGDYKILLAIIISFALSFSLNTLFDDTGDAIRYTRESNDTFRNSTICVTENGREFSYHACPIRAGEWSWVIDHEGWFHVGYFTELK